MQFLRNLTPFNSEVGGVALPSSTAVICTSIQCLLIFSTIDDEIRQQRRLELNS